ncbi:DoxX family protein [Pseudoxanthomonas sp. UTMC 1351]|uniref:HvfX family Cu-binding RiPP maturation protein n=1 Tax=Pseudoxanthomonas sp. UTMC 1351 TaxID=2695853 RepID=UPI0034CE9B1D
MNFKNHLWPKCRSQLEGIGRWLAPLGLRLILAWEFYEAGREKLRGENWFPSIMDAFPFPFDRIPAGFSWTLATWFELIGGIALLLGLGTRFFAASLFVLTVVATAAVHWPQDWMGLSELAKGYAITNQGGGNYKLPLIYLTMLLPLIFHGAGKLSVDALFSCRGNALLPSADRFGWGVFLVAFGLPLSMLLPLPGLAAVATGLMLSTLAMRRRIA